MSNDTFNEWEAAHRAVKVAGLIGAIDKANPLRVADAALATALQRATPEMWADLATIAGVKAPSDSTQRQVIATLFLRDKQR